jgi:hypothetical protein
MCRIDGTAMTAAERWFSDRRQVWDRRLDRLDDLLHEAATTEEEP